MRLPNLGIDKDEPTVVVLGAGASRGSSCARSTGVAPPLDADFFVQAQRLPGPDLTKRDRDLFNFVREEFGQGELPTLEVFFTQTSAVDRFHHEFNIRGRVSGKFGRHLATLRNLIPRVFGQALRGLDCKWHRRLVAALRAGDSVLSFNYDTLAERALRDVGGKRWNPAIGYGFPVSSGLDLWSPPPSPGPAVRNPIQLLKPHGSLNWNIDSSAREVRLVEEYDPATADSIVPPSWDKSDVAKWPWNEVWRSARNVLGSARMLIVVGYSVPVTDQLSQALLRADIKRLNALIVVNPDSAARRRVLNVMSSGLDASARVVELSTISEFGSYLPRSRVEPADPDVRAELADLQRSLVAVARRVNEMHTAHGAFGSEQSDLKDLVEELDERVDKLSDELEDELQNVRGEIQDVDAQVDSLRE